MAEIIENVNSEKLAERKAILKKIAALRNDPAAMLTINMNGKMEGNNSISTSCRAMNSNCQRRIAKAIADIRKFSPEADSIISRYLLPSEDKRHISGKAAAEKLEAIGCPVCICVFCYADKAQSWQDGARIKFLANFEILNNSLLEASDLPEFPKANVNGDRIARIEAEGDTQSVTQARNYIRMVNKNSGITFAVWTKNPGYWIRALQLEGYLQPGNVKPANLIIVLSSRLINTPDVAVFNYYNKKYPGVFDYLFTVYTKKYAAEHNIDLNCCTNGKATKCKNCKNSCYEHINIAADGSRIVYKNEILR